MVIEDVSACSSRMYIFIYVRYMNHGEENLEINENIVPFNSVISIVF
jgi:hypothetical protein